MPLSKHYHGKGAKVMRAMRKTYQDEDTAQRVFYATENRDKNSRKHSRKHGRK